MNNQTNKSLESNSPRNKKGTGKVYLVGAGPGNPDYITIAGLEAIKQADCFVYDKLAPQCLMDYASQNAERIDVGKTAHRHCMDQEEINRILIDHAKSGKTVVRLKGGDPLLFARGAEEACALEEHEIPYEIIPGVTSALAAAACAGIPLTHRATSSLTVFVTGHEIKSNQSKVSWDLLARLDGTIVIYMGLSKCSELSQILVNHGKSTDTPTCLVQEASLPSQTVFESTLGELLNGVPDHLRSPVLMIVGETCKYRDQIKWYSDRPLAQLNIWNPRPVDSGVDRLSQLLRQDGANVIELPTIEIQAVSNQELPIEKRIHQICNSNTIVFSSKNGVRSFLDSIYEEFDARIFYDKRILAIGQSTVDCLMEYGLRADQTQTPENVDRLIDLMQSGSVPSESKELFLIVRTETGRKSLMEYFDKQQINYEVVNAYRQVFLDPDDKVIRTFENQLPNWIVLTSVQIAHSTINWIRSIFDQDKIDQMKFACLSKRIKDSLPKEWNHHAVYCEQPSIEQLIDLMKNDRLEEKIDT